MRSLQRAGRHLLGIQENTSACSYRFLGRKAKVAWKRRQKSGRLEKLGHLLLPLLLLLMVVIQLLLQLPLLTSSMRLGAMMMVMRMKTMMEVETLWVVKAGGNGRAAVIVVVDNCAAMRGRGLGLQWTIAGRVLLLKLPLQLSTSLKTISPTAQSPGQLALVMQMCLMVFVCSRYFGTTSNAIFHSASAIHKATVVCTIPCDHDVGASIPHAAMFELTIALALNLGPDEDDVVVIARRRLSVHRWRWKGCRVGDQS